MLKWRGKHHSTHLPFDRTNDYACSALPTGEGGVVGSLNAPLLNSCDGQFGRRKIAFTIVGSRLNAMDDSSVLLIINC